MVESPSLEILKNHLDIVLGNQLCVALLEQKAGPDELREAPSNLHQFVIL